MNELDFICIDESYDYALEADLKKNEVLTESVLNKLGISKKDLCDPAKVKQAISKIDTMDDEYEIKSAIITVAGAILSGVVGLTGLVIKSSPEGQVITALLSVFVSIGTEGAKYSFGVSDYRKLLGYINREISRIEKKKAKMKQKADYDKEAYKDLEDLENKLEDSKDVIFKEMRKANRKVNTVKNASYYHA